MTKRTLVESTGTLSHGRNGLFEIKLIGADIQGSSGYYPREVLERDGSAAFPKNTKVYLDHPSLDEAENRPERSVRNIAGYLTEDAEMREDGLYGKVQFGRDYQTLIEDFAPILGMSIRAPGEIEESEDESGIMVKNVTAIYSHPMNSVDVVTVPGAQGAIVGALNESFREISEGKETERTVPVDEKDIQAIVAGVIEALQPTFDAVATIAESLKPAEEEETGPDLAEVTESAVAAGLTKTARGRVVEAVKAGTPVEEAIETEKAIAAEILAEAKVEDHDGETGVVRGSTDLQSRFESLFGGK